MPVGIGMDGFDDSRRRLKDLGDVEKTRQYKAASDEIAEQLVIPAAQAKASTRGEQQAARTLVAVRTTAGGAVRIGGGFDAALGYEFGADRNQRRLARPGGKVTTVPGWNQFRPWRGSGAGAGYFLYPAIRENEDEIIDRFATVFDELLSEE